MQQKSQQDWAAGQHGYLGIVYPTTTYLTISGNETFTPPQRPAIGAIGWRLLLADWSGPVKETIREEHDGKVVEEQGG